MGDGVCAEGGGPVCEREGGGSSTPARPYVKEGGGLYPAGPVCVCVCVRARACFVCVCVHACVCMRACRRWWLWWGGGAITQQPHAGDEEKGDEEESHRPAVRVRTKPLSESRHPLSESRHVSVCIIRIRAASDSDSSSRVKAPYRRRHPTQAEGGERLRHGLANDSDRG